MRGAIASIILTGIAAAGMFAALSAASRNPQAARPMPSGREPWRLRARCAFGKRAYPSQRFGPTHRTIVEAGVGEASAADAARGQRDGGDLFVLVARHI